MAYVKSKCKDLRGHRSEELLNECQNYINEITKGFNSFIVNEGWNKPISDDEPRERKCDIEASYLCHEIWNVVMNNSLKWPNPEMNAYEYVKLGNQFMWTDGTSSIRFHYDIMNNPSCELASKENKESWSNIYHHIGNMAPIPWFEVAGGHSINGQTLHKSLDERWDLYLNVLRSQWNNWNKTPGFSFEDYMILTCQQMYYADIYKKIKDMRKISMKDIDEWNEIIRSNPDMDLVSFKLVKGHAINAVIKDINRLIYIRDKVIGIVICNVEVSVCNTGRKI